eukprot:Lankesteria_metandrocarpae@DN1086_c0_g1_i1.p1
MDSNYYLQNDVPRTALDGKNHTASNILPQHSAHSRPKSMSEYNHKTENAPLNMLERVTEDELKEIVPHDSAFNGCEIFQGLIVLNKEGNLGSWNGYSWKSKNTKSQSFNKIAHDNDGQLWGLSQKLGLSRLTATGWKPMGMQCKRELVDLAFDGTGCVWAVTICGDLLKWNKFSWTKGYDSRYRKLKSIAFDKIGRMWSVSAAGVGVWNEEGSVWEIKTMLGDVRPKSLSFDEDNQLWCVGGEGELCMLCENRWINFGHLACWSICDLSFIS